MSQLSHRDSIKQADIIEEVEPTLLYETYVDQDQTKIQKNIPMKISKVDNEETLISPWIALFQQEKQSKGGQIVTEHKAKSDKQQVLKKIRKEKPKKKSTSEKSNQPIQSLPQRKILPDKSVNSQGEQDNQTKTNGTTSLPKPKNPRTEVLNNFRKNRYRKKNYNFEDKITKIKDIKANENNLNIKGEIIFSWEKQLISEKWAKTQMICVEVWDGTGAIVVAIPVKLAVTRMWELEIGKYVSIQRAQSREKYPRRICLLLNDKSQIKYINRAQVPKQCLIDPQKLGITLKQLQNEPVGRTCNIICVITHKQQKQFIRNAKNADLSLSKLTLFDPIDNKTTIIKLWQEKADLKFFTNATVYLLRGIQVKEFKGLREYDASKDFNCRVLAYSKIGTYLREFYQMRDRVIAVVPDNISRMNIKEAGYYLDKQKLQHEHKQKQSTKIEQKQQQPKSPKNQKKQPQQPSTQPQTPPKIPSPSPSLPPLIFCSWSITILKLLSLQLKPQYPIKYTNCPKCLTRTPLNPLNDPKCQKCSSADLRDHYCVKCQYYDGNQNYLGEVLDQAGEKIFSIQDQVMKIGFLEQTNSVFKDRLAKEIVGDTVKAVVVSTKERIANDVWVNGYYIVDILPFQDDNTQQTHPQSTISTPTPQP